ncbi:hypothetical protein BGZ51_009496 [Haplosporangium sp. Z 767]|nr:hypothetical protein BGZ51_009496 [Haplosporangium sp. Z 767]KAF9191834.1 hypothetical protein BGZ50_009053 [Haplosporangium sp. Z 11]
MVRLGPTLPGAHAFPPGPGPVGPGPGPLPGGMQGYGAPPPPFFGNNAPPVPPPPPGSRRPVVYPGQPPIHSGSHPVPLSSARSGQQYHNPAGYKQPYMSQGYPPDYQQVGYYPGSEGWRPAPIPALQKKPKELDKAMWVGNVLNDTTLAELQAIFEAEPTEAEGDVQHDIPEDPASDPYSNKVAGSNRFPHSQHHYPFMPDAMGYYNNDHPGFVHQHQQQQQQQPIGVQHDLSDAQLRMERMRLEASPIHDSSSSTGDGPSFLLEPGKHKDRGSSKKSRSSSSLGYVESRYFILKGLNEEDLKVSVQYGIWATQDHLVPTLNDAFVNSKNVYLVFSANKSGEFFGYARMMDLISAEKEVALVTGKESEIWHPAFEMPLSPEMKAAMLEEIEQANKEGRQITCEEANAIARASTTTKSWGIRFPIQWIHVLKVPFSKTSHLLNPLYENREVKVSKDGTEVDPIVGEQLLELFKKPDRNRRGRASVSGDGARSNSEVSESRRSSVTSEATIPAHQPTQRSTSSRRSSVLSMRSTGSGGGGDRRSSIDPSRTSGTHKQTLSPQHALSSRGQFGGGDGNQIHPNTGSYRSSSRHNYYGGHGGYIAGGPQGVYPDHQPPFHEQHRPNWNYKSNYRGGAGGYGPIPSGGPPMQGNYYQHDGHGTHRKGSGGGSGGGKYGAGYHPSHQNNSTGGGYDPYPFPSPNAPRRHPGPQQQQYPPGYRSNGSPPGVDASLSGPSTYKHAASGNTSGISGPQGTNDQNYGGSRGGPVSGRHAPSNQPMPPHSNTYAGQVPAGGYHAPFPPTGYAMMSPYMGYPYVPGPTPFVHGTMAWHPAQGLPLPAGMIPGAGMVPSHGSSVPMMPNVTPEGPGMEGLVPLIGYDGVTYGYIPAEEAYHQAMYGYGYMPHDPHAAEQAEMDAANHASDDGQPEPEVEDQAEHGTEQGSDDKTGPQSLTGVEQGTDQKHNESSSTHSATSAQSTSLNHDHSAAAKKEPGEENTDSSIII